MAADKRPGGLTALAVFNFLFGGLSLLGSLALFAVLPLLGRAMEEAADNMSEEQLAQMEAVTNLGGPLFIVLMAISLITSILMIVSGVGYLKLKKFLGRTLGNAYAVLSIVSSIGTVMWMPAELGGGFNLMVIVGLIYPVLTLILLNSTFKEDFVN